MVFIIYPVLLKVMVLLLAIVIVEGKLNKKANLAFPDVPVDCSGDYHPCTCQYVSNTDPLVSLYLTCNVTTDQDFNEIRRKLSSDSINYYVAVRFILMTTLDIPQDVLGGKSVQCLELSCSDLSKPFGKVHATAFRSTENYTEKLEIEHCDLTNTSLAFLQQFTVMRNLFITSSSFRTMLDVPYLPQLETISFSNITHFESWYSPASQTPNLVDISIEYSPDLDDRKMDSILSSMTKNFTYPKLEKLLISGNSLTRFPPLVSIFPALTTLELSDNPITTLAARSVYKGSTKLKNLLISGTNLTNIEPGAFVGDFSSTWIDLSHNPMTSFPSSVFKDLLKSMINNRGYVDISGDHITFNCDLAWLLTKNRNLLLKIVRGSTANGRSFENLNERELINC